MILVASRFLMALSNNKTRNRSLWTYVAIAFNKVDQDRLKLVGPDRLCAEWILKNGGAVTLVQAPGKILRDYNGLPPESTRIQIMEIDATNSSIMKIGFEHLKSCNLIKKIILHSCQHLESDGLNGLTYVRSTLEHLQISSSYNISDQGLGVLKELAQLRSLIMFDLPGVNNLKKVITELQPFLTKCVIDNKV